MNGKRYIGSDEAMSSHESSSLPHVFFFFFSCVVFGISGHFPSFVCLCRQFSHVTNFRKIIVTAPTSPPRTALYRMLIGDGDQYDWMTGRPHEGNEWRKFHVVPRSHPLRPCVFANRSRSKGVFRLPGPGAMWDHFRCTVEPSPGHIRCRADVRKHQSSIAFFQTLGGHLWSIRHP